jgi:hypothetical protein
MDTGVVMLEVDAAKELPTLLPPFVYRSRKLALHCAGANDNVHPSHKGGGL